MSSCPFSAITAEESGIAINSGCKLCRLCIKACTKNALSLEDESTRAVDHDLLGAYGGILVYVEHTDIGESHDGSHSSEIHPVTYELIGEAKRLTNSNVSCLLIGDGIQQKSEELRNYGVDRIYAYDHPALKHFRADAYADIFTHCIELCRPSAVLVGATSVGRSLAPRVAVRHRTGLTADCTKLELRDSGDLVQIRPAFGGNIMAQIVTPRTRPQFATVRYKVMKPAPRVEAACGEIIRIVPGEAGNATAIKIPDSGLEVLGCKVKEKTENISEAEKIIAVGRGLKDKKDLDMVSRLAESIGATVAVTRPLVEAGYLPYTRQIGLSGRTVCPKLIITLGISGQVQFTASMRSSGCIIAVNKDRNAQIFDIAHYGIVGDMYEIIPELTAACLKTP